MRLLMSRGRKVSIKYVCASEKSWADSSQHFPLSMVFLNLTIDGSFGKNNLILAGIGVQLSHQPGRGSPLIWFNSSPMMAFMC